MTSILRQARRRSPLDTFISCRYPSTKGKRKDKRVKLGCYEHLTQVIADGFDPTSEAAMHLNKDYKEGGLLIMSKDDQRWIASCLKKEVTAVQKNQEVIAYLFEFGCNLALSQENNVSQSPRFESNLGSLQDRRNTKSTMC
jgi:hypothetical protein